MQGLLRIFSIALALIGVLALSVIAYKLTYGVLRSPSANPEAGIDYTNVVVILLTTVTVIFSVCALALAILAVVGFRSLKRDAGKYASQQALSEISAAFNEGGRAHDQIQREFTEEDGHLKRWVARQIRSEVISLLPLVIDRLKDSADLGVDDDAPTDEGEVD